MRVQLVTLPKIPASLDEVEAERPIGRSTERFQMMLAEMESLAQSCEEFGIDAFGTTEHHFHSEGREMMPSPLLLYTKLASQTEKLIFSPSSLVLPALDPVRTAEDVALFDQMFPGRMMCGLARGYQKRWMQTLMQDEEGYSSFDPADKVANERNRAIFNEHVEILLKAWSEDSFAFDGEHYKIPFPPEGISGWAGWEVARDYGVPGEVDGEGTQKKISVVPPPASDSLPEMFVPFSGSPQTLIDCANRNFAVLSLESKPDKFRDQCELYLKLLRENGHPDAELGSKMMAVRSLAIADTKEEAMKIAANTTGREYFEYFQNFGFGEPFRNETDDPDTFRIFSSKEHAAERMVEAGNIFVGTPDDIVKQLEPLKKCHGEGDLEWLSWTFYQQGNESPEVQRDQLKLFAEEIRPHL